MPRFPPRRRRRMVELILIEILAVPADRSRGKHRPRVVKRKMSSFPTKSRAVPVPRQVFHYGEQIRIVAPEDPPKPSVAPPTATPIEKPRLRPTAARPGSSMSDPGAAAVCHEPSTAIATT